LSFLPFSVLFMVVSVMVVAVVVLVVLVVVEERLVEEACDGKLNGNQVKQIKGEVEQIVACTKNEK